MSDSESSQIALKRPPGSALHGCHDGPISSAALTEIAAIVCVSMDEIDGCVPADAKQPFDMRLLLARLLDGSRLHEFKAAYGTTLITGFARIHGHQVRSGPAIPKEQVIA